MQEILEEFEDKYGHLKEDGAYDELYDLFRNFLYQACIRYAEGIVPEKKKVRTDVFAYGKGDEVPYNECIDEIHAKIQEDTQSPIS